MFRSFSPNAGLAMVTMVSAHCLPSHYHLGDCYHHELLLHYTLRSLLSLSLLPIIDANCYLGYRYTIIIAFFRFVSD